MTGTTDAVQLTYRLYKEADLEGLLHLWKTSSGWGEITKEQFTRWYLDTPHGPCIVIVCVDNENKIFGQIVFIPSKIYHNGRYIKALRVSSPILSEHSGEAKITDYVHPVFCMLREGMNISQLRGYELVYMFPSIGWTSVLKLFPKYGLPTCHISFYDCFSLLLDDPKLFRVPDGSLKITVAAGFTDEYDQLWMIAKSRLDIICGVVRNSNWMRWKLTKHLVLEARDVNDNTLKGYIAFNTRSGLVTDFLAISNDAMEMLLLDAIHALHHLNPKRIEVSFNAIKGMATERFRAIMKNIAWQQTNYTFSFACYSQSDVIRHDEIAVANWYIMPND